ncbi:EAL domain-containing protein [Massilia sp. 9096]|uniref:EAL domain-containing protein n=1 Tax=Massilia sp. 9096 TaxID=1500894 RepID=UPI00056A05E1|nr:EAL domain-containing protein [Massilia sp. 9096]
MSNSPSPRIAADIGEPHHACTLLRQSRARLDAMLETIGDAFFALDHDWRITYANRKAAAFVGLDLEASLGRGLLEEFGRPIRVSVNVSARQLCQGGLVGEVRAALEATGLAPACLELELTESALIENVERAAAMLGELTALGIKLALDDFGTGYSGLAYLRRLPIDVLKLDRSFVLGDDGRIGAFDFIKAFVDMAHALRMAVVAEGVETRAVLEFLRAANCDEVQGYLLARPMPPDKLRALLAQSVSLSSIS